MDNTKSLIIIGSVIGGLLAFIIIVYLLRKLFQGGQFKSEVRIDGKVVIVTGCNTGIGKETALDLAKRGGKIYMACRDPKRCEAARLDIIEQTGNQNVFNRTLDLASLESVRNFVKQFLTEENHLDILINNAGVMACPKSLTADGFEMQIGTNHMGHFLLTNLLLDCLKKSAPSRIVVVSSLAHTFGSINKNDLNSKNSYSQTGAYNQSKLANVLFTRYLAKLLTGTGVTVNSLHPGVVDTELARHFPAFLLWIGKPLIWVFFKTSKSGAQTTLRLAVDPELAGVTGKYFSDCKPKNESNSAKDDAMAEWLWQESERWTGMNTN